MPAAARLTLRNWWKLRWARTVPPFCTVNVPWFLIYRWRPDQVVLAYRQGRRRRRRGDLFRRWALVVGGLSSWRPRKDWPG